jgi:ABC-2 type transport system permease protein
VRRVSTELPARPPDTALFDWLLQSNLLPGAKPEMFGRLQNPFQSASLPVTTVHPTQETTGAQDTLNMAPFLVALLVMIPLFTSGSYLLTSLTEEKGNRIMEILLVSLRPPALLAGKLLGLGALTMVQYLIWIVLGAAAFLVVGADFSALTSAVNLAPSELVLVLLYALGGYALYATLMAGLGALSPNMEGARTWVFVITLPMLIPIYLWVVVVNNPGSALALALSLIPFSAPIAMLMRLASATVPTWQVVLSLALLAATAVGMIWLMSRLFRTQTLLSGEPFSVGRFWSVLREG